jgi:hypothetical protein
MFPGCALPADRWGAGWALMNTARQLGTVIVTLVYEPVIDLAAVRLGWVLIAAAALISALVAAALAVSWSPRAGDAHPDGLQPRRVYVRHRRHQLGLAGDEAMGAMGPSAVAAQHRSQC